MDNLVLNNALAAIAIYCHAGEEMAPENGLEGATQAYHAAQWGLDGLPLALYPYATPSPSLYVSLPPEGMAGTEDHPSQTPRRGMRRTLAILQDVTLYDSVVRTLRGAIVMCDKQSLMAGLTIASQDGVIWFDSLAMYAKLMQPTQTSQSLQKFYKRFDKLYVNTQISIAQLCAKQRDLSTKIIDTLNNKEYTVYDTNDMDLVKHVLRATLKPINAQVNDAEISNNPSIEIQEF
jgi:hypothetical protein